LGCLFVVYFSKDFKALDTIDFWVGTFLIFIMATIILICFGWVLGIEKSWAEAHRGADLRLPRFFKPIFKYISPLYLLTIFAFWVLFQVFRLGSCHRRIQSHQLRHGPGRRRTEQRGPSGGPADPPGDRLFHAAGRRRRASVGPRRHDPSTTTLLRAYQPVSSMTLGGWITLILVGWFRHLALSLVHRADSHRQTIDRSLARPRGHQHPRSGRRPLSSFKDRTRSPTGPVAGSPALSGAA
jgi:hypothetical protein